MKRSIPFTKMHGAGNDYIYVHTDRYPLDNPEALAVRWSAPHTGIGSDGLVLIGKSDVADFKMRIFNADGSEAKMCGNATRCIGKYVYENKLTDKTSLTLETLSGIKELQLTVQGETVTEITVDMGAPAVLHDRVTLDVDAGRFPASVVSMGNPHLVIFEEDLGGAGLEERGGLSVCGPQLEHHRLFPDRTNVEFVKILSPREVRMRVWERGSGITMACGTGACATAVAGVVRGKTGREIKVHMEGGTLTVRWDAESDKVFMTGKAIRVFEGTVEI
ncbi:MAG: diaminopimelate epimerase [Tannerellaceae bacterium]|jgi:diaminopimelate epimerase|nr:diaminopimelate epimerase [Tannerellaceae bacterium]